MVGSAGMSGSGTAASSASGSCWGEGWRGGLVREVGEGGW